MMRAIRAVAALAIAVAAALAVYQFAYLPWRADVVRKSVEANTLALLEWQPMFGAVRARENIAIITSYIGRRGLHNSGLYMTAAANYRYLEQMDNAVEMYRAALKFDQRPEIYYNLGMVEWLRGRTREGEEILVHACMFDPFLISEIPDVELQRSVQNTVRKHRLLPWLIGTG